MALTVDTLHYITLQCRHAARTNYTFPGLLLKDQIGFLFPYTVYAEPYAEPYAEDYLDLDTYYGDGPTQAYSQGDQTHTDTSFQEHSNYLYWSDSL